jgi:DNA-binding transcriptional MerR regulator
MPTLTPPPRAFWTIGEVAAQLDLPQHVLKYWEARFEQVHPLRSGSLQRPKRLYRQADVALLNGIRYLIYGEGYSIRGVQKMLRDRGPDAVRDSVPAI